ncbi:indole-3-glycerol phosphate synthase TrpC [Elusimicrobiota bacterium]
MNSILENIVRTKKETLELKMKSVTVQDLKVEIQKLSDRRNFKSALSKPEINIIAEIKKASPSAGIIKEYFDIKKIAKDYTESGAAAISVLTEEKYFKGDLSFLKTVKENSSLPILRKDFVFEEYQIYESLASGADAVLLIAAIVDFSRLKLLLTTAKTIGIDCLVEVHNEEDLEKALSSSADIIGINNRDLNTFDVDLNVALKIYPKIPKGKVVVVESGIKTHEDIKRYEKVGIKSFLIGESLMRSGNVKSELKMLRGKNG